MIYLSCCEDTTFCLLQSKDSYVTMEYNLKLSTSRKSLHKLSQRQRNRVKIEVKRNLHLQFSRKSSSNTHIESNKQSDLTDIPPLVASSCSSTINIQSDNIDIAYQVYAEDDGASLLFFLSFFK